ncbi:MAG: hypothetical protein M0Q26_14325 [Chitinophagaceae bacterium]|nr:hypothetical protein [Chitinophagaceae bacterium]
MLQQFKNWLHGLQLSAAKWLTKQETKLTTSEKKMVLIIFCLVMFLVCTLLLFHAPASKQTERILPVTISNH